MIIKMVLTNGFDPDPRVYKEAKTLVGQGHDVEILCWDRENRYIDREYEVVDEIKVKRFFPKSVYGSGNKQFKAYLLFIFQISKYLKGKKYEIIHAHDIDGAFAGCFVKKGSKMIWDMHEFYDGFNYSFIRNTINNIMAKLVFRRSEAVVFVVRSQKDRYSKQIKKNTNTELIMNCSELEVFKGFKRCENEKLRIAFIGSVREKNTLIPMIEAAEKFNDVIFYIHGMGVAYEEIFRYAKGFKNTIVTGGYDFKKLKELYENTDIIYSVYDSHLLNVKEAFPVKGFEAIATETPIIASKNTYFGNFLKEYDIGFSVNDKNSLELEDLIREILLDRTILYKKAMNIRVIKKDYTWESQSKKLIELYNSLM